MRQSILICLLFLTSLALHAQQFGGTPSSRRWKQISTDTARIIFPAGLDSSAQRIASVVHYLAANPSEGKGLSLGHQLHKINIVLQNHTTIGNGYVGLGPYRSEFYLTPVANNFQEGSIAWPDQLAVHEYRHVQQYNNFRNGLSKTMYYLFGEEGLAVATNASVPDWFYEGDAVYNETILTRQGRGRLPLFLNSYPSLWQAGKKYSWMKLRNGSLKDYVPNHYYLGYLLVNYGREKYGMDFWSKVTNDASAFKGLIYPFQKAIKKHAGVDYKTFREQAFDSYKKNTERVAMTRDQYLLPVNSRYITSYIFPYSVGNDSLLYLKTTYRHRPAFYIKDKNGEHQLRVRDISIDDQFSYRNGKIVYAAYEPDLRWTARDYSVIKLLDLASGQQRTVTSKTKYFTPDISAAGDRIAAVEVSPESKSSIHILDAETGKVLHEIRSADIMLFTDPKFIDENSLVTAVRLKDGKMALALAEISSGNTMRLTPPSFNVVGYPCVNNGKIYFTASWQGNDDLFVLRLSDKKIARVTNGPLGNYFVNAANGKITWSVFTAEGYQLRQANEKDIAWEEVQEEKLDELKSRFEVSHAREVNDILLHTVPSRGFNVTSYKKSTKLLNFHSWRPYYEDPVFTYSLYGENVLNTLQTELYYLYNQNEKTNAIGFSTVYGGLFPHLSAGTQYTFRQQDSVGNQLRQWSQLDTRVGINVPLNFTSGKKYKFLNIGTNYFLRNEFTTGPNKNLFPGRSFTYLHHFISWSQQVEVARQHIFPRWGSAFSLNHRYAVTNNTGYQFIGSASLYFPGFFPTHSIVINGSFQQRDTLNIPALFPDRFPYSRGYTGQYFSRMWKLGANYHFPVLYPDWGFGNILYISRVRANAFYDFTRVYSRDKTMTRDQRSVGGEFYFDTNWWNQYPLTFGFRVSRLLDPDQFDGFQGTIFEFILPVSIIPR
jgi:hypothetical protein